MCEQPRAQADKRFTASVKAALDAEPNIDRLIGRAGRILVEQGRVTGLAFEDGDRAWLPVAGDHNRDVPPNGLIHIGPEQHQAGRWREPPSRDSLIRW